MQRRRGSVAPPLSLFMTCTRTPRHEAVTMVRIRPNEAKPTHIRRWAMVMPVLSSNMDYFGHLISGGGLMHPSLTFGLVVTHAFQLHLLPSSSGTIKVPTNILRSLMWFSRSCVRCGLILDVA